MMEIQEDKLQQRILKLRKKQNNGQQQDQRSAYSPGGEQSQMEAPQSPSFLSPLTCARNSRRYLNSDKRGTLFDDDEEDLFRRQNFQMTGMPRGEYMSPEQRKAIHSQLTDFSATPAKKGGAAAGDNSNL